MEKNCINCKYNIPVTGADYGFCNHKGHLGRIASEHTLCSDFEYKNTIVTKQDLLIREVLQALRCCANSKYGCKDCDFKGRRHSCQQDLLESAADIIDLLTIKVDSLTERLEDLKKETDISEQKLSKERINNAELRRKNAELERLVSGYTADQEIWLTRNDYLEKENKSLWNSYHKGYSAGYEYGKQDALSADRAEPVEAKPEITKSDIDLQEAAALAMNRFRNQLHLVGVLDLHKNGDKVLEERNYILERYYGGVPKELKDLSI